MILVFLVSIFLIASASGFDAQQHKNWNLLPHNKCGAVWRNRIIGGHEAEMNSYPWMVQIGYLDGKSRNISFQCGGAVVTSKVILTAGHCIYFPSGTLKVGMIRLGEHDTETNPDCDEDYCADPVVDIIPSEIIVPKTFKLNTFQHDIAIIRLKNEIKFTSFIKPICLLNPPPENLVGSTTEVAGWGIYDIMRRESSTKLQVIEKKVVEIEKCEKFYGHAVKIGPDQICAGGELGKDSCGGDSGGPLMKIRPGPIGPRYYLLGVVSFGSKKCGRTIAPAVYTNMFTHMEWFLNNLEKTGDDSIVVQ